MGVRQRLEVAKRVVGVTLRVALGFHAVAGALTVVALLASRPWVIARGQVGRALASLEGPDFRWAALAVVLLVWALPLAVAASLRRARLEGARVDALRALVTRALDRAVPVAVDIQARVPVRFAEALKVPVEVETSVGIEESLQIEAELPIRLVIPLDTVVETQLGKRVTLKVPIKASVPVDLTLPFKGTIRVKADAIPVKVSECATVRIPPIELPVACRVDTQIGLLDNLRDAERRLLGPEEEPEGREGGARSVRVHPADGGRGEGA